MKNAHRIVVRKPERKRPQGSPRHGWENNTEMNVTETGVRL
jgi:hypothetical protein